MAPLMADTMRWGSVGSAEAIAAVHAREVVAASAASGALLLDTHWGAQHLTTGSAAPLSTACRGHKAAWQAPQRARRLDAENCDMSNTRPTGRQVIG